ncbi:MAG: hypothetical protein KIY11_01540 [Thermoplasmata archaeon]|nr:hypothetical protein [Candidatus Sysuiplasma acidicola]
MRVDRYLVGIQPRTEELIAGTRDRDRNRITEEELEELRTAAAMRDFSIQMQEQYTFLSDPMFHWQDLIRPFVDLLEGQDSVPQLTRWFDNNTFYRRPVIDTYPSISHRKLLKYYFPRLWESGKRAKVIVPSPYTLYASSEDSYFPDRRSGVLSFAQEMERVALFLEEKGARQIEFVEPFLFFGHPEAEDIELAADAFNLSTQKLKCEVMIHFPFGKLEGHFKQVMEFNATVIGIDFFSTALSSVTNFDRSKGVAIGCLDARNSRLESVEWVVNFARSVAERIGGVEHVALIPSADMEFLPRSIAEEKMKIIGEAARRLDNDG